MKRLFLAIILLLCGVTFAIEINVPGDYANIQSAINAANDYDVIVLEIGIWAGAGNRNINFSGKAVTLTSTDPNDPAVVAETIIDAGGSNARCFDFSGSETIETKVVGITITNGNINYGGGIYCNGSSPTIDRCVITSNTATVSGGGVYCTSSSGPKFIDCVVENNSGDDNGGGIFCNSSDDVEIVNCVLQGNTVVDTGFGAGVYLSGSDVLLERCYIEGNYNDGSSGYGGGFYIYNSLPVISSCVIAGNSAKYGAGVSGRFGGIPTLKNCTFYGNRDTEAGAAIYFFNAAGVTAENCIVYGNSPAQIYSNSTITVQYSDVMGGYTGTGNIDADPLFVDPGYWDDNGTAGDPSDDLWVPGNLHIDNLSPCFNAGDPGYVMSPSEVDIDMDERVRLGRIDMGADETGSIAGDITEDGIVNYADLAKFAYSWGSSEGDAEYDKLCDLAEPADGAVGTADLVELGSFWLDQAPWY